MTVSINNYPTLLRGNHLPSAVPYHTCFFPRHSPTFRQAPSPLPLQFQNSPATVFTLETDLMLCYIGIRNLFPLAHMLTVFL